MWGLGHMGTVVDYNRGWFYALGEERGRLGSLKFWWLPLFKSDPFDTRSQTVYTRGHQHSACGPPRTTWVASSSKNSTTHQWAASKILFYFVAVLFFLSHLHLYRFENDNILKIKEFKICLLHLDKFSWTLTSSSSKVSIVCMTELQRLWRVS